MKKWIVILIAIILIGATSSGALAGHIYYKEMKTYEDYDRKELQMKGLENIYIDSDIPVNVKSTQGPAYVEFSQRFTDIIGKVPTYQLEIEKKESTAYIKLEQKTNLDVWIGVKENKALCTVYLPSMAINKLTIKELNKDNYSVELLDIPDLNLKDIDIKELLVDTRGGGTIYLDGNYEKVDITQNYGKVEMNSKLPVDVTIDGDVQCNLTGIYKKIKVQGNNREEVVVDSQIPAEVWIESTGNIILNGSYKQIDIEGSANPNIAIKSDTLCEANVHTSQGNVKLEGAIRVMTVKVYNLGQLNINTTVIPKRIDILGNCNNIKLMLPNNTPGIEVTYNNDYFNEQNDGNEITNAGSGYEGNDSGEQREIISDYAMQKNVIEGNIRRYISGDASTKVLIEANIDNSIYILDNGYISGNIDTQETVKAE